MLTIFKLSVFLLLHFTKMQLSKIGNFKKCTTCKKGDWGFPQIVKSQKSVCGGDLQIGLLTFLFSHVWTHVLRLPEQKFIGLWGSYHTLDKDDYVVICI